MDNRSSSDTENRSQTCPKHSGIKHVLMMAACCMVPLAGALILNRMDYGGAASFMVMLLCPLLHIFMMRGMHGGKTEQNNNSGK